MRSAAGLASTKIPAWSKQLTEHKHQGMISPTRKPMQQQSKVQIQTSKQDPKTAVRKTARKANEGVTTKIAEKDPTLGNARGPLHNPAPKLGDWDSER